MVAVPAEVRLAVPTAVHLEVLTAANQVVSAAATEGYFCPYLASVLDSPHNLAVLDVAVG